MQVHLGSGQVGAAVVTGLWVVGAGTKTGSFLDCCATISFGFDWHPSGKKNLML